MQAAGAASDSRSSLERWSRQRGAALQAGSLPALDSPAHLGCVSRPHRSVRSSCSFRRRLQFTPEPGKGGGNFLFLRHHPKPQSKELPLPRYRVSPARAFPPPLSTLTFAPSAFGFRGERAEAWALISMLEPSAFPSSYPHHEPCRPRYSKQAAFSGCLQMFPALPTGLYCQAN